MLRVKADRNRFLNTLKKVRVSRDLWLRAANLKISKESTFLQIVQKQI